MEPSGCCRFYPTCTRYAQQQLNQQPLCRALKNIIVRVLSCNPLNTSHAHSQES